MKLQNSSIFKFYSHCYITKLVPKRVARKSIKKDKSWWGEQIIREDVQHGTRHHVAIGKRYIHLVIHNKSNLFPSFLYIINTDINMDKPLLSWVYQYHKWWILHFSLLVLDKTGSRSPKNNVQILGSQTQCVGPTIFTAASLELSFKMIIQ